jgi:hypothetical protein
MHLLILNANSNIIWMKNIMNQKIVSALITLLILSVSSFSVAQTSDFESFLKTQELVTYKKLDPDSIYADKYQVYFSQPMDHFNPQSPTFTQKLYIGLIDKTSPTVVETEGYSGRTKLCELADLLKANYINVEHRYFGDSVPADSIIDWRFMNIEQAANDHHKIIQLFKGFFNSEWISTGISKGGQTTIYHSYFFPDDVDVRVPYVAPITFGKADKRLWAFLESVSTKECRDRVTDFQKLILENRDSIMVYLEKEAAKDSMTFSIGLNAALEYSVLEYSFAFWQWEDGDCSKIPGDTSSIKELWDHLNKVSGPDFFSDQDIEDYIPFFYQSFTQTGFYDYDIAPFGDLIKYVDGSNDVFFKGKINEPYDHQSMKNVAKYVREDANNFLFIYGEFDPWTATAADLTGKTNSIKMIHPEGSHRTRIKHFSDDDKELIYSTLEKWLEIKIVR